MMTAVASETMGITPDMIKVQMGSTGLPPGPTQGGSNVTSTVGSAVYEVCAALKEQIAALASKEGSVFHTANVHEVKVEELVFSEGGVSLKKDASVKVSYTDLFQQNGLPALELTKESKGQEKTTWCPALMPVPL
jgi:xanthine dehydrogenase YagR molybdenum-binding subunit